MNKNEAFEVVYNVVSQVSMTGQNWELVKEALAVMAKELDYAPEPEQDEVEDLEKPKGKK
jgi:hypothetical protein